MAATKLTAGVPASIESTSSGIACTGRLSRSPSSGASSASGTPVVSQWARLLIAATSGKGKRPGHEHVERAVLVVVVEDAVGGEERGEQERDPQHAGRDAGEKVEVGPKPERRDGDHDEIEAERRADGAAFAKGEPHVAGEEGEGRAHETRSLPSASCMREFRLERRMARHQGDAARSRGDPRWRRSSSLSEAASSEDLRLVEQPDRTGRGEEAGQREPSLLPGRQEAGGKIGKAGQARRRQGRASRPWPRPPRKSAQKARFSRDAEARLHRVGVADIVAKLGKRGVGAGALETKRAAREREEPRDLPQQARLAGAVRAGDEQRLAGRKAKARSRKMILPPRWQLSLRAARPIAFRHLLGICAS